LSRSSRSRWIAPAAVVAVVAGGAAAVPSLAGASDAAARLPERSAAQLLDAVGAAHVDGLSGSVVQTSRLGLPELPDTGSGGGSAVTLTSLLSGSTTARIWMAGEDRSRIAVDAPFSEYDVVRDVKDLWTYDSAGSKVNHVVLPEGTAAEQEALPTTPQTPQEAAKTLLEKVDPTTKVSVGRSATVAGRSAYELVLEPRTAGTLVQSVRIAVDGKTSVPLRVRVFGTDPVVPAFEVAFTSVRFEVPSSEVFSFVPPPGATVKEQALPSKTEYLSDEQYARKQAKAEKDHAAAAPEVLGTGWASVVELKGAQLPEDATGLLQQMTRPVDGGRVLTSRLLSVLLLDDGRVFAGSVPAERLVELAKTAR